MAMKINGLYLQEREPDAIVGGCIAIYENIWPNSQSIIDTIENEVSLPNSEIFWEKAPTLGQGVFQKVRTNKMMAITHLADSTENCFVKDVNNMFYTMLLSTSNSYAKKYGIKENFYQEHFSLLKYSCGEEYKVHYDGATDIGRCISAICYLNGDFDGGELEFVNFGIKIKPEPGMLVLFPSNYAYAHIAHPVKSGTKYAMVTWIKDRIV